MLRDIKKLSLAVAGLALLGLGSSAHADLVTLNSASVVHYVATNTVDFDTLTYITSITVNPFTISTSTLNETGTITEGVFSTASGTLDFAYQFNLDALPGGDISSIDVDTFSGFTTAVGLGTDLTGVIGYNPFSIPGGGINGDTSGTAKKDSEGAAVTFDFDSFDFAPSSSGILESDVFVVATNATAYGGGLVSLEDNENSPQYSVYSPAPLPASAGTAAALLGCVGAFSVIRRRVMA
jgi:hypothetical protein